MRVHFALVSEGSSEAPLVEHLEVLCLEAGAEVATGYRVDFGRTPNPPGKRVEDQLTWLNDNAPSVNLVFIHRDADERDDSHVRALIERGAKTSALGIPHIAVVPIQELEAWLLLDEQMIRAVAGNPSGKQDLGLPKPKSIEARANPKELLEQAIMRAAKRGGRRPHFPTCRRRLLERLDIDGPIKQLSAWQQLRTDVAAALTLMMLSSG